ncbi:MAG: ABC transporter permease [Phototrophicaceae bacterium]
MNRLSIARITALVATIVLGLAFLIMPLINAPVLENDALTLTDSGEVIRQSATALSLALDSAPTLEYSLPTVNLLSIAMIGAVIAMAASFIPLVKRTARYILMIMGILALFGFFAVPLQTLETDVTNYSQMLSYGFWIGVLASVALIIQGVMGRESDVVTTAISDFTKNIRVSRQQLLSTILIIIGIATLYQGLTAFQVDDFTADDGTVTTAETITTTLNFAPSRFGENPNAADPLQLIVPTGLFITISSLYFLAVGALGIANLRALKRVMPILLIFAAVMIFLVLLVGSAAGGSTNATTMITESLRTATPIAIGAMAGIWCERSGVINIAIEGMMLFGAAIGFTTLFLLQAWYPNPDMVLVYMILGVIAAVLSGGLVSLLHAWLSITFATDQIVSGTVINILALGSTSYIRAEVLLSSEAGLNRLPIMEIPILSKLPVIGPVFASQPIFYMMFVVIIVTHVVLYHTRWGLRTIAVGENPHAADTLGINVNRVRWINVFIGGMIAGLAGAWFSLEATGRFTDGMTDGKGFISLAAMIFGKWTPAGSFGGSLLFGFSESLGFRFQIENVALPPQFLQMVPYIVTLIVLAGLVGRAIPPKAVGQPYKTEGSR